MLICKKNSVPKILQKDVVIWYHTYLLRLGTECTEADISQHYYWRNLRDYILTLIKVCKSCQKIKKQNFKYGKLPNKEAEASPWDRISIDLISPYKIRRGGHENPFIIKALTVLDPEAGWFEILQYNYIQAAKIANLVYQTWLCRYPCPIIITYDHGNEFLSHTFKNDII